MGLAILSDGGTGAGRGAVLRPNFDGQAGNGLEIGIGRDERAIGDSQGNCRCLHIDLLDRPPSTTQVGVDAAEFASGGFVKRRENEIVKLVFQTAKISVASRTQLHPAHQLAQDWETDSNPIARANSLASSGVNISDS